MEPFDDVQIIEKNIEFLTAATVPEEAKVEDTPPVAID